MIQRQRRKKRKKPLKSETQTHTQTEEANTEDTIMPSVIFFFSLMKPRSRKEKNPEWSPFQIITKLDVACHHWSDGICYISTWHESWLNLLFETTLSYLAVLPPPLLVPLRPRKKKSRTWWYTFCQCVLWQSRTCYNAGSNAGRSDNRTHTDKGFNHWVPYEGFRLSSFSLWFKRSNKHNAELFFHLLSNCDYPNTREYVSMTTIMSYGFKGSFWK